MIYDKFAKTYDRLISPLETWFLAKWRKQAVSLLPENSLIVEIGAGTGNNFALYQKTNKTVASDLSIEMLRIAHKRSAGVLITQADATNLPFPDNHFDAALGTLIMCSIPDPQKAFSELKRVLKSNGRIVLLEHVRPSGILGYLFDVINVFTVAFFDDHFNRETAIIAKDCGLEIVEIKRKARGIVNLIVCEVSFSESAGFPDLQKG